MEISIFLAKIIGLYLIITGIFTFVRYNLLEKIITDISNQRGSLFFMAILTLIMGLLLVVSHNIWVSDWRIIITLIGWLTLIGGLVRLFFLDEMRRMTDWWLKNKSAMLVLTGIFFLLGCYLVYKGFWINN